MSISFTDRELDLMAILWELGSATVADVHERLEDDLAYTTVLTTLRNMEKKGHVRHEEEGRAFRYYPTVLREQAGETAVRRIVNKVFGGSRELFLTHLVSRHGLSEEAIGRLEARLETGGEPPGGRGREAEPRASGRGERPGPAAADDATETTDDEGGR